MKTKVLQVFYNENGLPFKDQERTVHFPIVGSGFIGASNTTQIRFYFKEIGDDAVKYVAVSKLPNGKVGSKVLENYYDSELDEPYALLELDSYYTQYKGDVYISLQGYQGGVQVSYNEDTELYEIEGTPTIQATGSIKFTNNYATQFVGSGEEQNITLQQLLAIISDTVLRYYVTSSNTLAEVFNEIGTKICAIDIEGDEYLCEMSGDTNIVIYDIHNQEWYAFTGANTTTINDVLQDNNKQIIATKEDLENFGNLFAYKGTASVSEINALTDIGNGWCYNLTDSGTLTLGNLQVEQGDVVAFNGSVWTKLLVLDNYYTKQEGQAFEQNVNEQISAIGNQVQQVASGSPKGVYATLSDLETAYPSGAEGIYVVSATGHWYYWNGSAWTDGGTYQATQYSDDDLTDTNGVLHQTIGGNIRIAQSGLYENLDILPINNGLKKYQGLPFKKTSVNSNTGEDTTDLYSISTRRDSLLSFTTDLYAIIQSGYRLRLIKFNLDGTFASSGDWKTNGYKIPQDSSYKYRIQIATTGGSLMVMADALKSVLFYTALDKIDEIPYNKYLNYELTPMSFYASKLINSRLEMSNIYTGNGGDSSTYSGDACRTPNFDKLKFTEDIIVYNKDTSKYRFRIFEYGSDETFIRYVDWQNVSEYKLTIDPTHYYRFAFATYNQVAMNIDEVVKYIGIYYVSNKLSHNSIRENDNFMIVDNKNTSISLDEIPDYWNDYLENKINQIKPYLTNGVNKVPFLFLTDTHYNGIGTNNIRFSILKYLASKLNINLLLHGGDLNSEHGSINTAREFMLKPTRLLKQCAKDFLIVRGNHDDNLEGGRDYSLAITSSDSYSYMFRQLENKVEFGNTGTYYYYDLKFQKIRYICLDCRDLIYDSSTFRDIAFTHEQLNWFCNVLKNTPNDYSIIILLHPMLAPSIVTVEHPDDAVQTFPRNYLAACDILKAYKNHTQLNIDLSDYWTAPNHQSYYEGTLTFDFSNNQATIIGVVSGHEHVDCIEEILDSNGNGIGIYNTCTQNDSAMFPTSIISYQYQHQMVLGTITEQVFDLFIVDKANKHVDIIRIGAGDTGTPRGFNYE